jgi:hypothetical protein
MCVQDRIRTQNLTRDWGKHHNRETNNLYRFTQYKDEQIYDDETGGASNTHGENT